MVKWFTAPNKESMFEPKQVSKRKSKSEKRGSKGESYRELKKESKMSK